ncbi:MAG: NADH-quinone oxidoreductase subunit NuoG [Acidimicrobiia bacterium]
MTTNAVPMSQWPSDHRYTIPVAGDQDVVTLTIDDKVVQAPRGELLIKVAQEHGSYIPRFCYHERMKPVGMCRMCLVEVEGMRGLQISCATPVVDGMIVRTQAPAVKQAQDGVLEFLLINHPLDCPVCDRGGECPLQDQTLAFGPGESRYVEEKRHFEKPIPISDLVLLDRERCIQCGRCTRFAAEIAGDALIDFGGRGGATEVITYPEQPFDSYFSGNVVQICPVGALTAQAYRFKARPWDLDVAETSCQTCSVGCRSSVDSTSNRIVRLLGVDSEPVNHGWLCDKGRYGYDWVHSDARLRAPAVRTGGGLADTSWPEALDAAADVIRRAVDAHGPASVAVLGGARGTNEDAYAWARLAKGVIGTDHIDAQLADGLPAEVIVGMPRATIADLDRARAIVVLGPDLKETVPVLALRARRAAVDLGVPLVEISPVDTGLTRDASVSVRHRPGAPGDVVQEVVDVLGGVTTRRGDLSPLVPALEGREGPVVVVLGRPSLAEPSDATVHAASLLANLTGDVRFLSALPTANVHGALDLGLAPGFLPGRVDLDAGRAHVEATWGAVPAEPGLDATGILRGAADGAIKVLVLLGCDPLADFPDRSLAVAALTNVEHVISVAAFPDGGVAYADLVLARTVWGEESGSTTNLEGRVMRLGRKVTPEGTTMEAWRIAGELAARLGTDFDLETVEEVQDEIARVAPAFAGVDARLLRRARDGVVLPLAEHADEIVFGAVAGAGVSWEPIPPAPAEPAPEEVTPEETTPPVDEAPGPAEDLATPDAAGPAAPVPPVALFAWDTSAPAPTVVPEDAYSLRLVAAPTLYGSDPVCAASPPLARLADDESTLLVHPRTIDGLGVGPGDLVRVSSATAAIELPVRPDGRVPEGTALVATNRSGAGAFDLVDVSDPLTELRVETIGGGSGVGA